MAQLQLATFQFAVTTAQQDVNQKTAIVNDAIQNLDDAEQALEECQAG